MLCYDGLTLSLIYFIFLSGDYSTWNRRGFLPNSDPIEALRGVASGKTLI